MAYGVLYKLGLLAFLSLIPFLIVYLIRPRPKDLQIPSLMFFLRNIGRTKINSFLRRLLQDPLFFLQLLALIILSLSISQPFISMNIDIAGGGTVFIIDVSASAQTKEGQTTRFTREIEKAKQLLGSRNWVILAQSTPTIALEQGSRIKALQILNSLRPTQGLSNIGDAIILGGELLADLGRGRIIVLSDFNSNLGLNPKAAKQVVESKNIVVDFIDSKTTGQKENLGFIDLKFQDNKPTAYIKNFGQMQKEVTIKSNKEQKTITIKPNSIETYQATLGAAENNFQITNQDDLQVDNNLCIYAPQKQKVKALLITSSNSTFLTSALKSNPVVELYFAQPPIIPKDNYDIYIISNVLPQNLLVGTFDEIKEKVKQGSSLIVYAQKNLNEINFQGSLPVTLEGSLGTDAQPTIQQSTRFTKNIKFQNVRKYLITNISEGATNIISVQESPLLAIKPYGQGNLVYYGFLDEDSDFKLSTYYPIFWKELIDYLSGREELQNLNYKTGQVILLDKKSKITGPQLKLEENSFTPESAGIYKIDQKTICVNLLSESESDINAQPEEDQTLAKIQDYKLNPVKKQENIEIEYYLSLGALLLLIFELIYTKLRGDV